jgi:hypothetical protein
MHEAHFVTFHVMADEAAPDQLMKLKAVNSFRAKKKEDLLQQVGKTEKWVHAEGSPCVNRRVPITHLPNEPLAMIFKAAQPKFDYNDGIHSAPITPFEITFSSHELGGMWPFLCRTFSLI